MFDAAEVAEPLLRELARLHDAGRDESVADLVALVEQCQSVVNRATAVQVLAMAHLAAIEDVALEDGTVVEQHRGLGHQRLDAPALVSEQLGLSDAAACSRMGTAVEVVTRVPAVHEAMASGRLDGYRAGIVCEELRDASPEVCREVGARIEGSLGTEPPAVLRRRVRRVLGVIDADLVRAKAARARSARSLQRWPGDEPGVDTWLGSFPVEQARSGWAVIDSLARQYVRDGRASRVDEARADALMDLIHARATGTFTIQLAVPADRLPPDLEDPAQPGDGKGTGTVTASGAGAVTALRAGAVTALRAGAVTAADDAAALVTVAGLGMPGDTHVRREWLEHLIVETQRADRTASTDRTGSTARRVAGQRTRRGVVGCHAETGALLAVDGSTTAGKQQAAESRSYRPPPSLVALVKARDGRCRFPGCTVSAVFCDLDHVRPWPSGPTAAGNLMCLCRRHHRIKQTVRWRVRIEADATVTWTDPAGRLRTTLPLDFLQLDVTEQPGDHACVNQPRVGQSHPLDEVGVLWSAWEDELEHLVARAERGRRRRPLPTLRLGLLFRQHQSGRHRSAQDRFAPDPSAAEPIAQDPRAHHPPHRGPAPAGAEAPPPF